MKNYNFQKQDIQNSQINQNKQSKSKKNKALDNVVYIIMIVTMVMLCPLIYQIAMNYPSSSGSPAGGGEDINERVSRNRHYSYTENHIDLSVLKDTEYGELELITAKVTDDGKTILFCTGKSRSENTGRISTSLRIVVIDNIYHSVSIYKSRISYNLYNSISDKEYVYKDYGDSTFFLSNNRTAFLFDIDDMKILHYYNVPSNYRVYQTALSNNKEMMAIAAEEGFFVCAADILSSSNPNSSHLKELISSYVNANGAKISARYPVWASDDRYIYYKMCADNFVRHAGITTPAPGGTEQLTSLESTNFLFLNGDSIFYYFSSSSETSLENLFRCGYFNVFEKKMTDVMKSQVYYFDIGVSSNGTHLAALSKNGNMIKISITDIHSKKLIYSSLYDDIYDFSFSPDEKNLIIYGKKNNKNTLNIVAINWTEE